MLIPRPKQTVLGERLPLSLPLTVSCADAPSERAVFALCEMAPSLSARRAEATEAPTVTLAVVPGISPNSEAYELKIQNGRASVRAKDFRGLIYAIATLVQSVRYENGEFTVPNADIFDYPDAAFRSFMPDPARNLVPMEELRALILSMAKAKLNKLHLHLSDSTGFSYESEICLPSSPGGRYSKQDLRDIIEYAAAFGIDVIPEIDLPAHGHALTKMYPNLKCRVEGMEESEVSGWNLCLGNPECYDLIDALLREIAEIFPYEYIHIGTDEIDMRDIDHPLGRPITHTEECKCCNSFFAPLGLPTLRQRFYWFVRRTYATVTSLGKKMMMWNDDIDISESPDIPRDILIEFWRVAADQRGPVEGCSMQRFLEEGFEVVNSDFPNAYMCEYMEWKKLKNWNFRKDPADASLCPHQVIGGDMCAWEGSNYPHYLYALYFAMPAFGDRMWTTAPIPEGKEATKALTRASLGMDTPDTLDVFDFMRDVPLGTSRFWEGDLIEDPKIKPILKQLSHQSDDEKHLTRALLDKIVNN